MEPTGIQKTWLPRGSRNNWFSDGYKMLYLSPLLVTMRSPSHYVPCPVSITVAATHTHSCYYHCAISATSTLYKNPSHIHTLQKVDSAFQGRAKAWNDTFNGRLMAYNALSLSFGTDKIVMLLCLKHFAFSSSIIWILSDSVFHVANTDKSKLVRSF